MLEVWTRAELIGTGMRGRDITDAVYLGALIRARRDRYVSGDSPERFVEAVRVGGRLACTSLLAAHGVFVFDASVLHVHMVRGASRMRSPKSRRRRLEPRGDARRPVLHWHPLRDAPGAGCVGIVDALIHAVRCQSPRHAIATLDNAVHLGLITVDELTDVFAALPQRFSILLRFIDGRAEAGTETLVRLMAIGLGCSVQLQVRFDGVGRVDLVIDGWLVVECDSKEFHSSWEQQLKDYKRDRALAQRGYCVLRLTAADILYHSEDVLAALRGLIDSRKPLNGRR
jgi:very-short-patch-repair endonuclease